MGYQIGFSPAAVALLALLIDGSVAIAAPAKDGDVMHAATLMASGGADSGKIEVRASLSDRDARHLGRFSGTPVKIRRDITLHLSENAQHRRKHTAKLPVGKRGSKIPVETIEVEGGRVDVVLPERPRGGVLIESSGRVQTIVTEGRASIVEQGNKIAIGAISGALLVGQAGRFKAVKPGTVRVLDRTSGTWLDREILPAPQTRSGGLAVALSGPAPVVVRTTGVPGAEKYRAAVLSDDGSVETGQFESGDPNELQVQVPRAGNYWVTVRAVDAFGIAGHASEPVSVQVLGLKNGGSVVRDGVLFLSPGQVAQVVGQEGLVMRYGTSPDFVPAPSALSLPGRKATTVEFRDPGDAQRYAVFKLAPRLLKTRIQIGPALGYWPRDDIDISVRMWDGHGLPLSWMDEYRPIVKVGVDEVPVTWERGQGRLNAVLPAQTGLGPWVVRVTVLDPNGNEIGRNFLEMVSPPQKKRFAKAKKR